MFTDSFKFLCVNDHSVKVIRKLSSIFVFQAYILLCKKVSSRQEIAFCCHSMLILWNIKNIFHVSRESFWVNNENQNKTLVKSPNKTYNCLKVTYLLHVYFLLECNKELLIGEFYDNHLLINVWPLGTNIIFYLSFSNTEL